MYSGPSRAVGPWSSQHLNHSCSLCQIQVPGSRSGPRAPVDRGGAPVLENRSKAGQGEAEPASRVCVQPVVT